MRTKEEALIEKTIDTAKSEAFADRMIGVLNDGALALMASIGHQVGLFDAMADRGPATSQEIAAAASLQERYVREWLGTMVTARVVDYEPGSGTYTLPPEHAAWLTRAAGADNLALQTQYIPLLAQVEERIVECFRSGSGVPYSAYPRFQQLMAEESAAVHDAALVDSILPLVPGLVERLRGGIEVADIGCGRGHAVNLMAEAFPHSRFTGYDISDEGIEAANREAQKMGIDNATFEVRDVASIDVEDRFDLITAFDAVHDQAHPGKVLSGVARALRPDGVFLMVDIKASSNLEENLDHPFGPFLYAVSTNHCMTVSLAQDGEGLGTMWGDQRARDMLLEAGFGRVQIEQVEGDLFNNYFIAKV